MNPATPLTTQTRAAGDAWPSVLISRTAFAAGLRALGEPLEVIQRLEPAAAADGQTASEEARAALLQALATPEQRLQFAGSGLYSYETLTEWAVRADLMRVPGLEAERARALAGAGVIGVRDLSEKTANRRRLKLLRNKAHAVVAADARLPAPAQTALRCRLLSRDLKQLGKTARNLPPLVVTDTAVILVVKGAGVQKQDETLGVFLNGFWPALHAVDPRASVGQRRDIFPPDYRSSAYDTEPLNHVTEVRSGERRVWIKEPNWEAACLPGSPFGALANEWRMATYAFGSWLHEFFEVEDSRLRRPNAWQFYRAHVAMYLAIFLQTALVLLWAIRMEALMDWFPALPETRRPEILGLAVIVLTLLAAIPPTLETRQKMLAYWRDRQPLQALPGLPNWVLLILILAFILSPRGYLLFLFLWITLQLALLRARAMAWPYREVANSDSGTDDYYSVFGDQPHPITGEWRVYKRSRRGGRFRRGFILLYRYIVVLALPLTFLGLTLSRLLKWTRILKDLGDALEDSLNLVLSGVLGDVVTYAMDPAQANRIRHVVESELRFFHDRPEVSSLHVFAHSQGTPITYETLFHYLPPAYRGKILTYVTIGSVLSYYHQANPVLDPVYMERFPVRPYPSFAPDFKWLNFWNLSDPITEFFGLDEYNLVKRAPLVNLEAQDEPIQLPAADMPILNSLLARRRGPAQAGPRLTERVLDEHGTAVPISEEELEEIRRRLTQRYPASPTNIKTRAATTNHSEYWGNLDQVQRPLARRVLGDLRPSEWDPPQLRSLPWPLNHPALVALGWMAWFTLLFFPSLWALGQVWEVLRVAMPAAADFVRQPASLLPPQPGLLGAALEKFGEFVSALIIAVAYFFVLGALNAVYSALIAAGSSLVRARRADGSAP